VVPAGTRGSKTLCLEGFAIMLSQPKIICSGGRFCRTLSARSVQIRWKRFGMSYGIVRRLWMFGKSAIGGFTSCLWWRVMVWDGCSNLWPNWIQMSFLKLFSVARCIWLRRNGAVFRQGFSNPRQIVTQGREAVCNFLEANSKTRMGEPDPLVFEPKWLKPSPGWVNLNWDATISSSTKIMGVGVVAHNDKGAVLAGLFAPVLFVVDPTIAEVMAAWRVVKLGLEMGYQQIILEGDSMLTVSALNQAAPCTSGYGQMIEDIQVFLLSFSFVVCHVGRQANFAAHTLAKYAVFGV
jgi:hypothetical protein